MNEFNINTRVSPRQPEPELKHSVVAEHVPESSSLLGRLWEVSSNVFKAGVSKASEIGGHVAILSAVQLINRKGRMIEANYPGLLESLQKETGLSSNELGHLAAEVEKFAPTLKNALPDSIGDRVNNTEIWVKFLSLNFLKNSIENYKKTPDYKENVTEGKELVGKSIAFTLDNLVGKLLEAEGTGIIKTEGVVDSILETLVGKTEGNILSGSEVFIVQTMARHYVTSMVDDYVKEYIVVKNDTSHAKESSFNTATSVLEKIRDNQGAKLDTFITEYDENTHPQGEKGVFFDAQLKSVLKNISPDKTPQLYEYVRGKFTPVVILVLEEFRKEGDRVSSGETSLKDTSKIAVGALSITKFLASDLLQQKNPEECLEALKEKFPGFANIKLPKAMEPLFLNLIRENGLKFGLSEAQGINQFISRPIDRNVILRNAYGVAPPSEEHHGPTQESVLAKPIALLTDFSVSMMKTKMVESSGDVAMALTNAGLKIDNEEAGKLLAVVANSDAPEIKDVWNGVQTYTKATIEELFVRFANGAQAKGNETLLNLVQNIVIKAASRGRPSAEGQEVDSYKTFSNDLLEILDLKGPEDLNFVPESLRGSVWETIQGDVIPNVLKGVVGSLFEPDSMREVILNALKSFNAPAAPGALVQSRELAINPETETAFGKLFALVADELHLPSMTGKQEDAQFINTWGRALANSALSKIDMLYKGEEGSNPLLNLVSDAMVRVAPGLNATGQVKITPKVELVAAQQKVVEATTHREGIETALASAKNEYNIAVARLQTANIARVNAANRTAELFRRGPISRDLQRQDRQESENAISEALRANEGVAATSQVVTTLEAELKDAVQLEKLAIQEAKGKTKEVNRQVAADRKEFRKVLTETTRLQIKGQIKGGWREFQKAFDEKIEAAFPNVGLPTKRVFDVICRVLFINIFATTLKIAGLLPTELFWAGVELYAEKYAKNTNKFLEDEFVNDLQNMVLEAFSEELKPA